MAVAEKELRSIGYMAELIGELRRQPEKIAEAMEKILTQQRVSDEAKERLHDKEASLLCGEGPINGRNAEIRNAQLRMETEIERREVYEHSVVLAELRAQYELERDRFSALKAVSYLLREE